MKVFIIAAVSLDGFIAKSQSDNLAWTGQADKTWFRKMTSESGVMIMGSKTYDTFKKPLPTRLHIVYTNHPEKYSPKDNVEFTNLRPDELLKNLRQRGYQNIAVIGGGKIFTLFLKQKLIDEIWLTICPLIFNKGIKFTIYNLQQSKPQLVGYKKINNNILAHYSFDQSVIRK